MDNTIHMQSDKQQISTETNRQDSQHTSAAPNAVYIHIPFCTNKCFYCDFNSYVLKDQPVMDYLRALDREMELTVAQNAPERIDSIFVGGGRQRC